MIFADNSFLEGWFENIKELKDPCTEEYIFYQNWYGRMFQSDGSYFVGKWKHYKKEGGGTETKMKDISSEG